MEPPGYQVPESQIFCEEGIFLCSNLLNAESIYMAGEAISLFSPEQLIALRQQTREKTDQYGDSVNLAGWEAILEQTRAQTHRNTPEEVLRVHGGILGIENALAYLPRPTIPYEGQLLGGIQTILKGGIVFAEHSSSGLPGRPERSAVILNIGTDACSSEAVAHALRARYGLPLDLGGYQDDINQLMRHLSAPMTDLTELSRRLFTAYNERISMPYCASRVRSS